MIKEVTKRKYIGRVDEIKSGLKELMTSLQPSQKALQDKAMLLWRALEELEHKLYHTDTNSNYIGTKLQAHENSMSWLQDAKAGIEGVEPVEGLEGLVMETSASADSVAAFVTDKLVLAMQVIMQAHGGAVGAHPVLGAVPVISELLLLAKSIQPIIAAVNRTPGMSAMSMPKEVLCAPVK